MSIDHDPQIEPPADRRQWPAFLKTLAASCWVPAGQPLTLPLSFAGYLSTFEHILYRIHLPYILRQDVVADRSLAGNAYYIVSLSGSPLLRFQFHLQQVDDHHTNQAVSRALPLQVGDDAVRRAIDQERLTAAPHVMLGTLAEHRAALATIDDIAQRQRVYRAIEARVAQVEGWANRETAELQRRVMAAFWATLAHQPIWQTPPATPSALAPEPSAQLAQNTAPRIPYDPSRSPKRLATQLNWIEVGVEVWKIERGQSSAMPGRKNSFGDRTRRRQRAWLIDVKREITALHQDGLTVSHIAARVALEPEAVEAIIALDQKLL
ncbi:MAG: hypothetical protein RLZZ387_2449 [Chloroflexota bacterium]|jgi:hypothetical protein